MKERRNDITILVTLFLFTILELALAGLTIYGIVVIQPSDICSVAWFKSYIILLAFAAVWWLVFIVFDIAEIRNRIVGLKEQKAVKHNQESKTIEEEDNENT